MVNLQLVYAHSADIRELAVDLSSSLTALSWLIKPPKSKIRGKKGKAALGIAGAGLGTLLWGKRARMGEGPCATAQERGASLHSLSI